MKLHLFAEPPNRTMGLAFRAQGCRCIVRSDIGEEIRSSPRKGLPSSKNNQYELVMSTPYFLLSSRLSIGEVKSGFADRSAAMVRTTTSATLRVRAMSFGLLGSRHLKIVPSTSIFARRRSTGIMLIYQSMSRVLKHKMGTQTWRPSAVRRLL